METLKTICIRCPMGCRLEITRDDNGEIKVNGNTCIRGEQYGKEEITSPQRIVTSLIKGKNTLYSVKTDKSVPKSAIFEVLKEIQKADIGEKVYNVGDVVLENVINSGANIVVTGKNAINNI